MDIRPLHRDERGEPTDQIHAIADGKIVHVNPVPGYSNYGRYVVIEHHWDGCSYFSLYGHLSTVRVTVGQEVRQGDVIAIMGYTGVGINRERAHVHLELNLMLSHKFAAWHDAMFKSDPNHNGIYNGINLTGLDIARLYLALRKNPALTIPQFLGAEDAFYKVRLPRSKNFELPERYPWMVKDGAPRHAASWEVSFTRAGLPLQVEPSSVPVKQAEVSFVQKSSVDYTHLTIGRVTGRNGQGALTETGRQYMRLLTWPN
jgi:murein DD-endopeptidase MepM/ murein hydrolase activator NlpD